VSVGSGVEEPERHPSDRVRQPECLITKIADGDRFTAAGTCPAEPDRPTEQAAARVALHPELTVSAVRALIDSVLTAGPARCRRGQLNGHDRR
jgi:hypothetical protein